MQNTITTGEVYTHKARLNIYGSRQIAGIHYDTKYSPVATWSTIRTLLTLFITHNCHTLQIDYTQAVPQAPIERDIYMDIPKGYKVIHRDGQDYVLNINSNLYGQVQAGKVWNDYITEKLTSIRFLQ